MEQKQIISFSRATGELLTAAGLNALREEMDIQIFADKLGKILKKLTSREMQVLQLRFGLEDGRSRTLEEVGKEFNEPKYRNLALTRQKRQNPCYKPYPNLTRAEEEQKGVL